MEKKTETTIYRVILRYIGIMEKKMETTIINILVLGFRGLGLYRAILGYIGLHRVMWGV